ncbi:hypothetical protein LCGC14_2157860, partial [marine sediment metagenome]
FDSFEAWSDGVARHLDEAPLIKVARAAEDAVRNTMKGKSRDAIARAEDDAVREAVFLVKLFLKVTGGLLDKAANYGLQVSLCARSLQLLLLKGAVGKGVREATRFFDAKSSPSNVRMVRDEIRRHAGTVYLHQQVINAISQNYFARTAILFPATARRLKGIVGTAETLAEEYNGFAGADGFGSEGRLPIDLEGVKHRLASAVRDEVVFVARMAKAETLVTLGRNEEGCALAAGAYGERRLERQ